MPAGARDAGEVFPTRLLSVSAYLNALRWSAPQHKSYPPGGDTGDQGNGLPSKTQGQVRTEIGSKSRLGTWFSVDFLSPENERPGAGF